MQNSLWTWNDFCEHLWRLKKMNMRGERKNSHSFLWNSERVSILCRLLYLKMGCFVCLFRWRSKIFPSSLSLLLFEISVVRNYWKKDDKKEILNNFLFIKVNDGFQKYFFIVLFFPLLLLFCLFLQNVRTIIIQPDHLRRLLYYFSPSLLRYLSCSFFGQVFDGYRHVKDIRGESSRMREAVADQEPVPCH